jgi:hypothetical protein
MSAICGGQENHNESQTAVTGHLTDEHYPTAVQADEPAANTDVLHRF